MTLRRLAKTKSGLPGLFCVAGSDNPSRGLTGARAFQVASRSCGCAACSRYEGWLKACPLAAAAEFLAQPLVDGPLFIHPSATDLSEQPNGAWLLGSDIFLRPGCRSSTVTEDWTTRLSRRGSCPRCRRYEVAPFCRSLGRCRRASVHTLRK
jgi:hypothetical protein